MNERLQRWFRVEGGQWDVDICRIVFYSLTLWWFVFNRFDSYADVPVSLYSPPLLPRWLGLPAPENPWIENLRYLWLGSLGFSALGLFTQFSTAVACALGFYLLGLDWSFGNTHHSHHLIVTCMFVMACARTGQYISLDRLLARSNRLAWLCPQPGTDETWCLRICQLSWCLMFFNAGLSKLRHAGLEFMSPANFQNILLVTHTWYARGEHPWHESIRTAVFNHPALATVLGGSGLLAELLAPLAFFLRNRWRWVIIGAIAGLQVGAYFLFYISEFKKLSVAYLFWIPWSALAIWLWQILKRPRNPS